jgi:hypothetical protein
MREVRALECVQVLTAAGYTVRGVTPIRFVLCGRDRKLVFVPRHGPISRDELRAILAAASLDEADFDRLRCERDSRPSGFESLAPNDGLSHTAGLRVRFDHVLNALGLRRSDARAS